MSGLKLELIKICKVCGENFTAHKTTTQFCSKICRSRSYKESKRIEANKNSIAKINIEATERSIGKIKDKEYFKVAEVAILLGVSRQTVYNMIYSGILKAAKITDRISIISKSDIDNMLNSSSNYQARPKRESIPITEFYTIADIKTKFNVKDSWVLKITKDNNIPKVLRKGKTYISKKHIDNYFANKAADPTITEWYSPAEIQDKYKMTIRAIYSFVYENAIPKKKDGRTVSYSKAHFDIAKGVETEQEPEYYTIDEVMEKFNLNRDAVYHYVKYHNISKVREGRYVKISKRELDKKFEQPIIL